MIKEPRDYSEEIYRRYRFKTNNISSCRSVTFVVTESCQIACKYCYQGCKSNRYMSFDTAKKIVDLIFKLSKSDESKFINTKTQAVILEFIGGEPLLNIDVIEKTCNYFWHKALELHHRFADNFRISIISNGLLYFDERVQRFIKKYKNRLSFG